jgi:predicted dehydrogenase/threonine dehydrogenase-like Zn-dependent dehydrogenase
MKQILQNLKTGATEIVEVPKSSPGRGQVLIRSCRSLISAGTERMMVDFGKAGWLEKARQQPEKVKQVLDKIRTDGLLPTMDAVLNKLDEPMSLGYCNSGIIVEAGAGIADLQPGDRVASNGPHAEFVCVPRNLCTKVPDSVSDEEASFTVLGSIALQGVRLVSPTLGECFLVFGLGLVGLLTVQLLRASGCRVLAADISETRLGLARSFGAEIIDIGKGADTVAAALAKTGGRGVDGVVIAASAKDDEIIHLSAQACRKRGRIVLVGVVNMNMRRSDFYDKEITFQVSCSYGPGRYDEKYEQGGTDYPIGFVRWTEQRNFEAILEAMRTGQLRVKELITNRIAFEETAGMYDQMLHDPGALGIVIEYPEDQNKLPEKNDKHTVLLIDNGREQYSSNSGHGVPVSVGVIGAGNYARSTLLPALSRTKANLAIVADINGVAALHAAKKFRAGKAVSDYRLILDDPAIQAVFILVGHHLHAKFICEVLEADKHVFVEKPLAIDIDGLNQVIDAKHKHPGQNLTVGFNRRFSPHVAKIKELLAGRIEPLTMTMTVNAGFIPSEHWTQDPERGGGRIIGEGCHFIDLLSFMAGAPVVTVSAQMMGGATRFRYDKMTILLGFADGSMGTVNYFANGSKSYPKETLEVFSDGRVIRMENFRVTKGYGFKGFRSFKTLRQDKGHRTEIMAFIDAVQKGTAPIIPFDRIINVTRASFAAMQSAKNVQVIKIDQ